ncbi:TolC family protein [Thermophagus sp. OGC60D27]|uniref:TolC family protein n=1 Tax=Thermophagus sp. OGC60D27 TaxID=3458415 RepID=UPI0040383EEA
MMRKTIYFILTIMLGMSAFSQTTISLEESRREALDNNKTIRSSLLEVLKTRAGVKEARTAYLPAIDGSASAIYIPNLEELRMFGISRDDLELYQAQFAAQQAIYAGGKVRLANKMAKTSASMAKNASEMQTAEIILQTDKAYWNLVAMQEQQKVLMRFMQALDSLEQQLELSYELGLVQKSELLKVRVQKNETEVTALEVNNAVRLLQMNLARIIGRPLETPLSAINTVALPDDEVFSEWAGDPSVRPEIRILEDQVSLSELQKKMTRADYLPQLGAQVRYGYLDAPDIASGTWHLNAGAQLSMPIIHWREMKHRMQKAEIDEQMAKLELENNRELINMEIQQAWLKLQEGIEKIGLAQKSVEEAVESLSEAEISYNAGLNTITDLLNAQAARQRAEASLVEAKSNYQVSKSTWLKAIGQLNELKE